MMLKVGAALVIMAIVLLILMFPVAAYFPKALPALAFGVVLCFGVMCILGIIDMTNMTK